jgi:glutamine amidotransferase
MLLSIYELAPARPLREILHLGLAQIVSWCREIDSAATIGLNILLTDGERLVGSRWGRTLHYVERDGVHDCESCGFPHIHHDPRHRYRAVVIASEPISDEPWRTVPERSVFTVAPEMRLQIDPLPLAAEAGQTIPLGSDQQRPWKRSASLLIAKR